MKPSTAVAAASVGLACCLSGCADAFVVSPVGGAAFSQRDHKINRGTVDRCSSPSSATALRAIPLELEGKLDPSKSWEVELELNGETKTITVPEGTSVLESAELVWDDPPHSCRNGVCTTCAGYIEAGNEGENYTLAVHGLGQPQREAGYTLTCQTFPTGPGLKVKLNQYDTVYETQYGQYEKGIDKEEGKKKLFGLF